MIEAAGYTTFKDFGPKGVALESLFRKRKLDFIFLTTSAALEMQKYLSRTPQTSSSSKKKQEKKKVDEEQLKMSGRNLPPRKRSAT